MADIADRIETAHVLLLEEIDGVGFTFGEQRDEDVRARHLVAARRLDMQDRALNDALEAAGGRGIGRGGYLERVELGVEVMRDGGLELAQVDPARAHHLGRMLIVDQREQQMLKRRIFVAAVGGGLERLVERGL